MTGTPSGVSGGLRDGVEDAPSRVAAGPFIEGPGMLPSPNGLSTPVEVFYNGAGAVEVAFGPSGCRVEVTTTVLGLDALIGKLLAAKIRIESA